MKFYLSDQNHPHFKCNKITIGLLKFKHVVYVWEDKHWLDIDWKIICL